MAGPAWCLWVCGIAMLAITLYGLGLLVASFWLRSRRLPARCGISTALLQVLMGAGMLVMLLPTMGGWSRPIWGAVFAVGAVWLSITAWRGNYSSVERATSSTRDRQGLSLHWHHAASSAAMAYMFAAAQHHEGHSASAGPKSIALQDHHAHGAAHGNVTVVLEHSQPGLALPLLAWLLAGYSVLRAGYLAADLVNSSRNDARETSASPGALSVPRLNITTELVMALAMTYMLLIML